MYTVKVTANKLSDTSTFTYEKEFLKFEDAVEHKYELEMFGFVGFNEFVLQVQKVELLQE